MTVSTRAEAFGVLGIPQEGTSWDDIRKAYKKRSRQTHPDLGGNPDDFHLVQQSFEFLSATRQQTLTYKGTPFDLGFALSC